MNFIRQPCLRTAILRPFRTGALGIPSPQAKFSRRSLATTGPGPSEQKGGSSRWLLVSIALGFPLTIYVWRRGSANSVGEHRGANQEYARNAEGNQGGERTVSDLPTGDIDKPRAMGSPKGPNSMSFKQEGLSNADSMNPYINEPGKSKKGEGETESAKVKGTVKPDRPQV